MRFILLVTLVVTLSGAALAQLKDEAMLLVSFIGYESEAGRKAIKNHLEAELSRYFELKSEEEVQEAKIAVADEIESENCSEEACIKMMGEVLMVDYIFNFEVIVSDIEWSIKGKREDFVEGIPIVINEVCKQCSLEKARQLLSEIVTSMRPGDHELQKGKGSIFFESIPSARLFLGGMDKGRTPLEIQVNAGEEIDYSIIAEGYQDSNDVVVLKPGQKLKIKKKLNRKRGNIRILSVPTSATVFLDGKLQRSSDGSADKTPIDLRPTYGTHKLLLKVDKYKDFETAIKINKRDYGKMTFKLEPKPARLVVRVPEENKDARIFINGNYIGSMGGSIVKPFNVSADESLEVYAQDQQAVSITKSITLAADESGTITFYELKAPAGFSTEFGAALAYEYFTYQVETSNKPISTSYYLLGFEAHSLLLPSRYRITVSSFSGIGRFTDTTTPFYLVVGSQLYTISETSASLMRVLVTPKWQPGWIYSIGFEQLKLSYSGSGGTLSSKRNSFSIEGGYEASEFMDFMIDNDLFLEAKLRFSTSTGFGFTTNFGGMFF